MADTDKETAAPFSAAVMKAQSGALLSPAKVGRCRLTL
jgi:hypothetical protein